MTIEELQRKHQDIWVEDDLKKEFEQHRNLSIQFAIEVLEEIVNDESEVDTVDLLYSKIQELKQYLNEEV